MEPVRRLTQQAGAAQVAVKTARVEAERRGTETSGAGALWAACAVMDGTEGLYPFVDHHHPDAVRISIPHAAQRVCAAAPAV